MPTVVVDLSFLEASAGDVVRSTLQGYTVLITFELIYEMLTNSRGHDPRTYLDKLAGLKLVQSRSLIGLVNREVLMSQRAENVLYPQSTEIADFVANGRGVSIVADVEQEIREFFETSEPQRLRDGLDAMWHKRFDDLFTIARQQRDSPQAETDAHLYLQLFSAIGSPGIGQIIARERGMSRPPEPGWLTYEWERLRNFLAFRFRLSATRSRDLSSKKLANDLADLTYIAFLPHVDAIATHDTKLIVPLARAFGSNNLTIIPLPP